MITRCDHCGSKFEVSAELVYSNDPGVRCGECMSLFDARKNLYDEAAYRSVTETLRPVQRQKSVASVLPQAETLDAAALETADTVAVEHIYTGAGATSGRHARAESGDSGIDNPGRLDGGSYAALPDVDLSATDSRDDAIGKRPDRDRDGNDAGNYPSEIEFERTMSTESSLDAARPNRSYDNSDAFDDRHAIAENQPSSRDNALDDDYVPDRNIGNTRYQEDRVLTAEEVTRARQQELRARERRALQIEPGRDFALQPNQDDVEAQRRAAKRDEFDRNVEAFRGRNSNVIRSKIDDLDLTRDAVSRSNDFIPDDVLRKSVVLRDSGRDEKAPQYRSDSPRFETSLSDSEGQRNRNATARHSSEAERSRAAHEELVRIKAARNKPVSAARAEQEKQARLPVSSRASNESQPTSRSTGRDRYGDLHNSEFQHLTHDRQSENAALLDDRPRVSSTSAQEMRRFQHYRPSVEVENTESDLVEERVPQATHRKSVLGSFAWALGLIAAVCLLLFAARNFIAGLGLPDPVLSGFCQITGCVPAEAKADVSQLKTMRQRLYPHPDIEDALVISVDVVNNSVFKQVMPTLAVSLMNVDGELVAERDFNSAAYEVVDGGESGFLMPGEPTRLKIELVDTGLAATDLNLTFK